MALPGGRTRVVLAAPAAAVLAAATAGAAAWALTQSPALAVAAAAGAAGAAALLALAPLSRLARDLAATLRALPSGAGPAEPAPTPYADFGDLVRAVEDTGGVFRELERAALTERGRLLLAVDAGADGLIAIDDEGKVSFANTAAERLFLRGRADMVGRPFSWLLPDADVMEALRAAQQGRRASVSIERPNHQLLQVTAVPVSDGGDWAALAVLHDYTDVRRAEQMRRDFVANVSHELRTPLASIKAVLETLEAGAMSDPAAARDFITRAETEVDRLTHMVTELLELSRIEAGEVSGAMEPVEAGKAVSDAVERLRSQALRAGVALKLEVGEGLPVVMGYGERIERAVMNLVHNALKFTPQGGEVRVAVRQQGEYVAVDVADNGPGIDERDLPRIFERFYKADNSRRTDGSGLGLALVKHTVEAHGGSVSVQSELGRGSKFTILLPAAARMPSNTIAAQRGAR